VNTLEREKPVTPRLVDSCGNAPLLAVAGPTGSGKSDAALSLAGRVPAEIVNCDSVQIYCHLNIGAAKLTPAERRGIPHHMVDVAEPGELVTAGDYARLVRPLLRDISARGRLPVMVGGTGFYLRAVLEGLFPGPSRDQALRDRLGARGIRRPGSLHRLLSRLDPPAASRIHPNDANKIIRALEIRLLARKPATVLYGEGREKLAGFRPLKLGLDPPRPALFAKLDQRARWMFDNGLVEEVRQILARGIPVDAKSLESLGYRQALAVLRGEMGLDQAVASTQRDTRRYAKRQWTWFRRDPEIVWFHGFGSEAEVQQGILHAVEAYLAQFQTV
jgi:tRNA dimethylallyltransferase